MGIITKTFQSEAELAAHVKGHKPSLYLSARTSTVLPYDKLEQYLGVPKGEDFYLCNLTGLPKKIDFDSNDNVVVQGPVSWQELRQSCRAKGRDIKTSPTEELAFILAGVATSCTGERCFGFGNLRSQIVSLKYIDYEGETKELHRDRLLKDLVPKSMHKQIEQYAQDFAFYEDFKNAPYPRFESETDLMTGTEGQLGIVTEVTLETTPYSSLQHLFILLPPWTKNFSPHLELCQSVQKYRGKILSCEIVDFKCISRLEKEDQVGEGQDVIFLEITEESFEEVYNDFISQLKTISEDQIFQISEERCRHLRAAVPRAIFETNSRMGVVKKGTDVQVKIEFFEELLKEYRKATEVGVDYNLFGHFGDCHLHFNFLPSPDLTTICDQYFDEFYKKVLKWKGSPFAEHGIGFLKLNYIQSFWSSHQKDLFKSLKKELDPHNQFFPQGFLSI